MTEKDWLDTLGELTGEQLYHLDRLLAEMRELAVLATAAEHASHELFISQAQLLGELTQLHDDVAIQQARITVPVRQAQGIVWRAVFARNHPVPVSGT